MVFVERVLAFVAIRAGSQVLRFWSALAALSGSV